MIGGQAGLTDIGWRCAQLPATETMISPGKLQMVWGIGKPVSSAQDVWFSFTKLGKYFLEEGEGWVYHSDNILTEKNVSNIRWQLLPDGDLGIRSPKLGSVQEEFNLQPMQQEYGLYCVYRTTLGQPACSYSYDHGHTWTEPELIRYASGLPLRNPRACPRLWKCKNGKYLLWYHNNGGKSFDHRNPAWIAGGIEKNGSIYWSQPEIFLYGPDHSYETGRFSYPDLVEFDGRYWVSTTQKTTASIHEVPATFFDMLWSQFDNSAHTGNEKMGSCYKLSGHAQSPLPEPLSMANGGFALDTWIQIDDWKDATILVGTDDNRSRMELVQKRNGTIAFTMAHRGESMTISSDQTRLKQGETHHIAILVDADARIGYMLIDGSICDGGGEELFGFRWFHDETDEDGGSAPIHQDLFRQD